MNFLNIVDSINMFLLKLVMAPAAFYRKMGVNTSQLFAILKTKLIIDNRRPFSLKSMGRRAKQTNSNTTLTTLLLSLVYGFLFLYAAAFDGLELQMIVVFSLFIFMLASILINDFTDILVDARDNYIILPKPVNDRTIVVSKVLHIFLHIVKIVIPMMLPALIMVAVNYNIAILLAFVLMVLFATMFTIFLINLLYVIILNLVSPTRFKSILSFIQIVFIVVLYGGFQLLPRMMKTPASIHFSQDSSILLLPSYWFAAGTKGLGTFSGVTTEILGACLAFIFPVLALYVMIRFLAPVFNRKLSSITEASSNIIPKTKASQKHAGIKSYSTLMAKIFTRNGLEKMGFLFSWKIGNRSKDFYMKVYPSFGYILVMIFIVFYKDNNIKITDIQHVTIDSKVLKLWLLGIVYFTGLVLFTVLAQLPFSEKYKAAWLFHTTPVIDPGKILAGAFKSIIVKFYLPFILIFGMTAICLFGWVSLPNLLLGVSNVVLIAAMVYYSANSSFPFSELQDSGAGGSKFMKNFFKTILMGILAVVQYFIFSFTTVVFIFLALSIIANWLLLDSIKKISWNKILGI